jgi:hypothetical protein
MRFSRCMLALLACLEAGLGFTELNDPLIGKKHLIIETEFVYVKRAPKIHNRSPLCEREEVDIVHGLAVPQTTPLVCPHTTFAANNILSQQKWTMGLRMTANYLVDKKTTWQARYLGFLHWNGSSSAACPGSLQFPFATGFNNTVDYQDADSMKGTCDTRYWSVETNYWCHVTPRRVDQFSVSWVFGLKYMDLNEHFTLQAHSIGSSSRYRIETKNRIAGPQLGGDIEINLGDNFTCGVAGKGGLMVNFGQNKTVFRDDNNTKTLKSCNPSDFNGVFFGEIAPFLLFNLSKRVLFKASYELTYLSNIALAMNQITFNEDDTTNLLNQVTVGGSFMFYGAFVGIGIDF